MKGLIFTFAVLVLVSEIGQCWVCPTNVQMFTEIGQRPVLLFTTNGLHTEGDTNDINTFQVHVSTKTIFTVNYENGLVIGAPYSNGCSLASSANLANGVLDIELDTVQTNDWGTYRLVHTRRTSSVIQCVSLYLTGTPTTPTIAHSGTLYEGTSLSLTCSSTSTTQPSNHSLAMSYAWTGDGSKVTTNNKFSFDSNVQKTLTISGLSRTDDSNRVMGCTATETDGKSSLSTSYTISVRYGPENIHFNPPGESKTYNDGDAFTPVSCLADCQPNCSFSWSKGGTLLSSTAVLNLGVVNSENLGTYTCTATHAVSVHTITKTLNVSVIYGPGIVSLSPSTTNYTVTEGDTSMIITCIAMCNPECTYTWLKSGTSVSSTDTLDLGQMEKGEAGSYVCMARNPRSGVSRTGPEVNISVRYGPGNVSLSPPTTSYTLTEAHILGPITCAATCNPTCTYTWSKSGSTLSVTDRLDLGQVEKGDAGLYVCTARNPGSGVSKNGSVVNAIVRYGPSFLLLSPDTQSFTKNEGETFAPISCSVDCFPVCNLLWRRTNGVSTFLSTNATLSLDELHRTESGTYSCQATNPDTHAKLTSHEVIVNIRYGPDNVTFDVPNVHTVTEGDTVDDIDCLADCWPGCVFTWINLTNNQQISTTEVLTFGTADRYDAGNYKCLARNSATQFTRETDGIFSLRVLYPPDVFISQSTTLWAENSPLDILCKASGVPALYNYTGFVQRVGDVVVPNSHAESPGVRDSISVNIPSLQLQDTGIYTCYVHNGITGLNKQLIQYASRRIDVSASPKFFLKETNYAGEKSGNITISIPFVSVPEYTTYSVLRHDGQPVSTNGKYTLHIRNAFIYPVFYGQQVTLAGNVLQITIGDLSENDFGTFKIQITNDINTASFSIDIKAKSKPFPPTELNLTTLNNTVTFEWNEGFNGGHEQTFVVKTSLNSGDSWTNIISVKESESKYKKENGKFQVYLTNVDPGVYNARIVAFNIIGAADPVEFKTGFEIMAFNKESSARNSVGPVIAGTIGGIVAAFVVAIVIVVIFRRKFTCTIIIAKRGDLNQGTYSEQRTDAQGVDDSRFNATQMYEAVPMTTDKGVYAELKNGNNCPDISHVYSPLDESSVKSHASYENVKTADPVYNNTGLKNQVQTVL